MKHVALFGIALFALVSHSFLSPEKVVAQQVNQSQSVPAANQADVSSVDAILNAAYDVISGPAGKRDWDRFRSLFIPEARFIIAQARQGGSVGAEVLDTQSFIAGFTEFVGTNGFYERDIARRVERYGNIAHVFSTYESRHKASDRQPFQRGINSFQLLNDGKRWWIVDIYCQEESPHNPIPKKYLRRERR
jgi:hypothetical protein